MPKLKKWRLNFYLIISVQIINLSCGPNIPLFGCIEGDCINGKGTWLESSGNKYIGNFKDGYRYGRGVLLYPDGEKWEGDWKKNKKWNGEGVLKNIWHRYKGNYKNGNWHGTGDYQLSNWPINDKYKGRWEKGKMHGEGKYNFSSGGEYEGAWY